MSYVAPVAEMMFVLRELAGLSALQSLPGFADATDDTVSAVLEESARLNQEIIAPLNWPGDQASSQWTQGAVQTHHRLPIERKAEA